VGQIEKYVVLSVLFVVALILGVSLNAPEGVAAAEPSEDLAAVDTEAAAEPARAPIQPGGPRARPAPAQRSAPVSRSQVSRDQPGATPAQPLAADRALASAEPPTETGSGDQPIGPAGLLSTARPRSTSTPAERPPAEARQDDGTGNGYLLSAVGLVPSLSDEFMLYTWQQGDSFAGLADRYFGSRLHVNRLLTNNEGLEDGDLRAGDQILVPVRSSEPEVARAGDGSGAAPYAGATTYVVQAGDVLGTISTAVYGTSKSWRKIYDANRDVLADPNRLVVGMVLRIPE
jgi:nucleoid-associated protein YgaU